MTTLEFTGVWWLPANPDQQVSGTLVVSMHQRQTLTLIGSFSPAPGPLGKTAIILGLSSSGKPITLHRCYALSSGLIGGGFIMQEFGASVAFIGAHFETAETIEFKGVSVEFEHLGDWLWLSGFDEETGIGADGPLYSVHYRYPSVPDVSIGQVTLSVGFEFRRRGKSIDRVELTQLPSIRVMSGTPQPFETFIRQFFYHIQNFLSLGVGQAVRPVLVEGIHSGGDLGKPVQAYYDVGGSARDPAVVIQPVQMLFSFRDIADTYTNALTRWFSRASTLKPVYDLYFATTNSAEMYLEFRFLNLVQALESYHRRVYGGTYLSDQVFATVYEGLRKSLAASGLNKSTRETFEQKLRFLNEVALRRRLRDILDAVGAVPGLGIKSTKQFSGLVADTRNYLTHFNAALESQAAKERDLFIITERVRVLIELCFLRELELPTEIMERALRESPRYNFLGKDNPIIS